MRSQNILSDSIKDSSNNIIIINNKKKKKRKNNAVKHKKLKEKTISLDIVWFLARLFWTLKQSTLVIYFFFSFFTKDQRRKTALFICVINNAGVQV